MRFLWYTFLALFSLGMLGLVVAVGGAVYAISYFSQDLPDYRALKDYKPPVVTRVYAGDGRLLAEYATEKRVFVPIDEMPDIVKQAFISAEDKNFYSHQGVDMIAIARAALGNLQGKSLQGASTITQQVAKNFLLSPERSYRRKIREAILAYRMEKAMSKDRLLELYLNEIYLGEGSYGIAAAALNYFNKPLEDLEIHEAAFLAALPKAPNNYHPIRKPEAALARRNWVLDRMAADGVLTQSQSELAQAKPLLMLDPDEASIVHAPYFAEEVRRQLIEQYGEKSLYGGGLTVRTSIDPRLQLIAERVLREGLVEYDRRHGYRGPLAHWDSTSGWQEKLRNFERPPSMLPDWRLAVVLSVSANEATIGHMDGARDTLKLDYLSWARKAKKGSITLGPAVSSVRDVLEKGDVIMVDKVTLESGETVTGLRQIPEINGSLIAMDPHTGRILAMQGGWSFDESEFNRVTQAWRQPGSAFKPFVYLAALDKGFTPATLVLDAPFVIDQGPGLPKWRPTNYSNEYYGPTPIRVGIEKSRNLMTVRLADFVGMEDVVDYSKRFGVIEDMPPLLANALGSGETTLMRLTTGYAQLVNGGKKITPTLIDRIQDRRGKTVYSYDHRPCESCGNNGLVEWENQPVPQIPDTREQIADPRKAYQIVSMLEGVVERGTGVRIKTLDRPLAGKTGTTNESRDTWFIGFSPDLVVGVFAGFDEPRSLGRKETGSSVAVPIFRDFMAEALKDTPPIPFRIPPGVRQVQINAETGARAMPGDERVIWESFLIGTEPTDKMYILDGKGISLMPSLSHNGQQGATTGTGGLY
ncbi:MAG: penicillin-binding protein 1A [Rhodospirillales bacterium]|nr:penicillin-binding protein 1A [Rhodospirillales bacterium]MCB9997166.1 penicillin-binding protein 1A [Rhodospirillales bacterium]